MIGFTRRNLGIAAGMLAAVALSAGALIGLSNRDETVPKPGADGAAVTGSDRAGQSGLLICCRPRS